MRPTVSKLLLLTLLLYSENSTGQTSSWQWMSSLSGRNAGAWALDIASDSAGNCYILGGTRDSLLYFSEDTLVRNSFSFKQKYCAFIAMLSSNGSYKWMTKLDSNVYPERMVIAENIYVTGRIEGPEAKFGNKHVNTDNAINIPFLACYNLEGKIIWVKSLMNTTTINWSMCISVDSNQNIYTLGAVLEENGTLNPSYTYWMIKSDMYGEIIWTKYIRELSPTCMTTDGAGNVYVGGSGSINQLVLASYDPSGNLRWKNLFDQAGWSSIRDIAVSKHGTCTITGWFKSKACRFGDAILFNYDTISMQFYRYEDAFIVQFDLNGRQKWARDIKSQRDDYGTEIQYDSTGNCYVMGYYFTIEAIQNIAGFGNNHVADGHGFIIRYDTSGQARFIQSIPDPGSFCTAPGATFYFAMHHDDHFFYLGQHYSKNDTPEFPEQHCDLIVAKLNVTKDERRLFFRKMRR